MEKNRTNSLDYLCFACGVRLHWNNARQQYWLLFPEGALALNPSAAAILANCDGDRAFNEIFTLLQNQFDGVKASDVESLLSKAIARGLLVNKKQPRSLMRKDCI